MGNLSFLFLLAIVGVFLIQNSSASTRYDYRGSWKWSFLQCGKRLSWGKKGKSDRLMAKVHVTTKKYHTKPYHYRGNIKVDLPEGRINRKPYPRLINYIEVTDKRSDTCAYLFRGGPGSFGAAIMFKPTKASLNAVNATVWVYG